MEIKLRKRKLEENERFYNRTIYDVEVDGEHVGYVEALDNRRESGNSFRNRSRIVTGWTTDRDWRAYVVKEPHAKPGYGLNEYKDWPKGGGVKRSYTQERASLTPMNHDTRREAVAAIVRWVDAGKPWKEATR